MDKPEIKTIQTLANNIYNTISANYPNFYRSYSHFSTNDYDLSAPQVRINVKELHEKIMNGDIGYNNGLTINNFGKYGCLVMNFLLSHKNDEKLNIARNIFKSYLYECMKLNQLLRN